MTIPFQLAFVGVLLLIVGCAREAPGWSTVGDVGRRGIVYGDIEGDGLRMLMTCQPKSGLLEIVGIGVPDPVEVITLVSGPARASWAEAAGAAIDGFDIMATVPVSDPVLQQFRKTGRIAIEAGDGRWFPMDATPDEHARVVKFFGACSRAGLEGSEVLSRPNATEAPWQ